MPYRMDWQCNQRTRVSMHRTELHCNALHRIELHRTALHRTALHRTVQRCTVLYRGHILNCTCTVVACSVLHSSMLVQSGHSYSLTTRYVTSGVHTCD